MGSTFNDVSWRNPFGQSSSYALATGHGTTPIGDKIAETPPPASVPNDTPAAPLALNSLAAGNDTSQEDALRQSYLSSLKPNTGFTFAGQNQPGQMSAVPGAKAK